MRLVPPLAAAVAISALAAPALAATKDECVDADTQAQVLRRGGKLADAREKLLVCADASCPDVVRADCAERMDELTRAQPTIVFDVKDGAGADLAAVTVTVDGKPLVANIDGSAVRMDPGPHVLTFQVAGQPPVTRSVVVKEGEKDRRESVVIGAPPAAVDTSAATAARARQTAGLITGGAGVAGLVVGGVLGGLAMARWNRAKSECNTTSCPEHAQAVSDHDATVTLGDGSTAAFVVGGALAATGAVLFFTGRSDARRAVSGAALSPIVAPGLYGLAVQLTTRGL
jgi:hypothetical protein